MKKINANNIVLIMSAGVGSRFGADKPKQYCLLKDRPVIEYAFDACRHASSVDAIVVVAAQNYVEYIHENYGFPTTCGGENRTQSLANGLKYVSEHYNCEKVIVANAVCPLMTKEQINRYFALLDEYDYVLTAWKVTSTLARYDGKLVDRNDYFHVMEPEAYRFNLLYENYKADYPVPYIFHQLPQDARGYYCFDYPYTMKITYPVDMKIAELLYEDINKVERETTKYNVSHWQGSFSGVGEVDTWLTNIPRYIEELSNKWEIEHYRVNPYTFASYVLEAYSKNYGNVILKFHAPSGRFVPELSYYQCAGGINHMAKLIDYDKDYRALLIKMLTPGMQVKFDVDDPRLRELYDDFNDNMISSENIADLDAIPSIFGEFKKNVEYAEKFSFMYDFRKKMEYAARCVWKDFFHHKPQFFLHRDLHRRNILSDFDEVIAIDPQAIVGPREFEFTIAVVIETKADKQKSSEIFWRMLHYFTRYCDPNTLYAALFFTWVHKMDEYVFVKHDNFQEATWAAEMIKTIFFCGDECKEDKDYYALFCENAKKCIG